MNAPEKMTNTLQEEVFHTIAAEIGPHPSERALSELIVRLATDHPELGDDIRMLDDLTALYGAQCTDAALRVGLRLGLNPSLLLLGDEHDNPDCSLQL